MLNRLTTLEDSWWRTSTVSVADEGGDVAQSYELLDIFFFWQTSHLGAKIAPGLFPYQF